MKKRIMRSLLVAASMLLAMLFGGSTAFASGTNERINSGPKKKVATAHPKTVRIAVGKNGFSPSSINVEESFPLTLIFNRKNKQGCGNKIVFPSLKITRNLPVGKPVTVKITPDRPGTIAFTCRMYKGSIVVE